MSRTWQERLRWWDQGPGRRKIAWVAALLLGLLAVVTLVYKTFHGPRDETTLAQLSLARSVAEGRGLETRTLHPQAAAWLASHGAERVARGEAGLARAWPDLYQPPGYPLVAGAALALLPASLEERVYGAAPPPPAGYFADYYLLGWGVVGFLAVAGATAAAGRKYFSGRVGGWAAAAVLLSAPAWESVVGLTGLALSMAGALAVFIFSIQAREATARGWAWALGAGALAAAWGLVDYSWLVAGPVVAIWLLVAATSPQERSRAAWVGAGWLLVLAPWIWRNVAVSGLPLGLAPQDLFLRLGDATADPVAWRGTWTEAWPRVDWTKATHKFVLHAKAVITGDFWQAGALIGALAVVGWGYRYRSDSWRAWRWLTLAWVVTGLVAEGFLEAGEGNRAAILALWPLLALWGASFLEVWCESRSDWRERAGWVGVGVLFLNGLPLGYALVQPGGIHFHFPPYYPTLLQTLGRETERRGGWIWMSDVPAGAAWYSGGSVWAKPTRAEDFQKLSSQSPVLALLLTPTTLDRPFFSELIRRDEDTPFPFWSWPDVYLGLAKDRLPAGFPLQRVERYAPNLVVLIDREAGAAAK